jgi:hypothetical protein
MTFQPLPHTHHTCEISDCGHYTVPRITCLGAYRWEAWYRANLGSSRGVRPLGFNFETPEAAHFACLQHQQSLHPNTEGT